MDAGHFGLFTDEDRVPALLADIHFWRTVSDSVVTQILKHLFPGLSQVKLYTKGHGLPKKFTTGTMNFLQSHNIASHVSDRHLGGKAAVTEHVWPLAVSRLAPVYVPH